METDTTHSGLNSSIQQKHTNRSVFCVKKLWRNFAMLLILLVGAIDSKAQESYFSTLSYGVEYDLMAPRIGHWNSVNLSAWAGKKHFKHSLVFVSININDRHLTEESFSHDKLTAGGYRLEYYFNPELKYFSLGMLLMVVHDDVITSINFQQGHFTTLMLGFPIGCNVTLWKHLTIQPGVSVLFPLTNRSIQIGSDLVQQGPWGLEIGLRIGYQFRWKKL